MEQTLQALGGILLKAIPTIFLLLLLHFYFKAMLFGPLERVLRQRDELTEGARRAAEQSLAAAERKAQEYEAKLREARAEVYRQQEETRRKWLEDQAAQVGEAHERMASSVRQAKQQIAAEAAAARQTLLESSSALADQIATAVLARREG
jgi:F-type H+-transporting ATPase subunit b